MSESDSPSDFHSTIAALGGAALADRLRFVTEIDKLKSVLRQTPLLDRSRKENDAEHSWHLAMMACVLADYADRSVDMLRVIRMLLIHDIVEIDAGDTFLYDTSAAADEQEEKEKAAADRIFGLLPADQATEFRALWDEFEAHESADAQFARAMDRTQPFLHNFLTQGMMWRQHGVRPDQVRKRMSVIADGSTKLHALVQSLIDEAESHGYFDPGLET
ncbi:HD domain-containing protein [Hwanghaeella sp.]|uniref:HD domain-containing protein n=1 Tax=Hwanghaeella sp. TaxID=2605943 RepID=UPI003CCBCA86